MHKTLAHGLILSGLLVQPALADAQKNYYKPAPSYSTAPDLGEPPKYARTLSETGIEGYEQYHWLDIGADFRARYEYRNNDFRRPARAIDEPLLYRTRGYLGIHDILDPFRFAVEFEDARRYHSEFARNDRDVNEFDFIQAYGELYFKDAIGHERPLSVKLGRYSFEELDRRLIGRNEWRNTSNTFDGLRVRLGQQQNDWQLDAFALKPVERLLYDFDKTNDRVWFYGGIGHIRQWSDVITLQPFYFGLEQNGDGAAISDRSIYSPGLRGYGLFGDTDFDYDFQVLYQFGEDAGRDHEAFGSVVEIGYTPPIDWKPRFSVNYGFATGDRDPSDNENNRFERFFGFARPWSSNDYMGWENIHAAKTRVEFQPIKQLKIDSGYSFYWLASDTDRWNGGNLRDNTGNSGDFLGHEFDIRARYPLAKKLDGNIGYAHFETGEFIENAGRGGSSEFFYLELSYRLFE